VQVFLPEPFAVNDSVMCRWGRGEGSGRQEPARNDTPARCSRCLARQGVPKRSIHRPRFQGIYRRALGSATERKRTAAHLREQPPRGVFCVGSASSLPQPDSAERRRVWRCAAVRAACRWSTHADTTRSVRRADSRHGESAVTPQGKRGRKAAGRTNVEGQKKWVILAGRCRCPRSLWMIRNPRTTRHLQSLRPALILEPLAANAHLASAGRPLRRGALPGTAADAVDRDAHAGTRCTLACRRARDDVAVDTPRRSPRRVARVRIRPTRPA
jgi:hypothetical protein